MVQAEEASRSTARYRDHGEETGGVFEGRQGSGLPPEDLTDLEAAWSCRLEGT